MDIEIGIVGPAKSGKTTIFNALTRGNADTQTLAPHLGVAKIPEPRLDGLASMLSPKKVVPAEVGYIDIGASIKGLKEEKGLGGQVLNQLSNTDALIWVTRAFTDECIPHPEGSLDVERDIASANLELAFRDLGIIEGRLERIENSLKGAKPADSQVLNRERELLGRIKDSLENDTPIRELKLTAEETKTIANYQFLTAKPLLVVVNIGEEQLKESTDLEADLSSRHSKAKSGVVALCGKLEMELSQLDESAAESFRAEFGVTESGLSRTLKLCYKLLGLISFFTVVSGEIKAWSIPEGTEAVKAAGKIHSDMERGFIRAEVISYEELEKCDSLTDARSKGLLKREGKSYIVKDGDVITFLFNV